MTTTPPPPAVPWEPGPPPEPARIASAGWGTALARGGLAFVAILLLAFLVAELFLSATNPNVSASTVGRTTGFTFFSFHHVGIRVEVPEFDLTQVLSVGGSTEGQVPEELGDLFAGLGPVDISFTVAFAMLLATGLAAWLLYRGGRAVALGAGGPPWARAAHGAKVAVPYAALSLGLALLARFEIGLPRGIPIFPSGEPARVGPSLSAAVLWPLALGAFFGALGGLLTARDEVFRGRWGRWALDALRGGRTMALYALALAFLAMVVHGLVVPDAPLPYSVTYFRGLARAGVVDGLSGLVLTTLTIPNQAVWVLVPAMGGAVGVYAAGSSFDLLSHMHFPRGFDPSRLQTGEALDPTRFLNPLAATPFDQGTAPAAYFLYLLVPLIATILAGRAVARRAGATTAGEGAGIGAASGVVFASIGLWLAILGGIGLGFDVGLGGFQQAGRGSIGPTIWSGTVLALVWGVAGGAIGGAVAGKATGPGIPGPVETSLDVTP